MSGIWCQFLCAFGCGRMVRTQQRRHLVQSTCVPRSYSNRLLASLPAVVMQQLIPHLLPVNLPLSRTLHQSGDRVDTIYFLEDGMCSMVVTMASGATVEVGRIGRDGYVGMAAVLGGVHAPNRCFMAIGGHGYSIKATALVAQAEASRNCGSACCAACSRCWSRPRRRRPATGFTNCRSGWRAGF
jgi:CRP-like cAMP-binding protein